MRAHCDVVKKHAKVMTCNLVWSDQSEQTCIEEREFPAKELPVQSVKPKPKSKKSRPRTKFDAWIPRLEKNVKEANSIFHKVKIMPLL